MKPHILYPVVHEAVQAFVESTGATACWISGVPRFPVLQVGEPDFRADRRLVFEIPPVGQLFVWVASAETERRVRAAVSGVIARVRELLPRASDEDPGQSAPLN